MEKAINNIDDIRVLINILPQPIREAAEQNGDLESLLEIVLDLGRVPLARYTTGEVVLSQDEITEKDIEQVLSQIGTFDLDNRAGMERTLHRISAIRNRRGKVVGLTCRVGRAVFGTLEIIRDFIESGRSILILGKPGIGKTTMLREAARVLAEKKRVVIVDTSNEIGGDGDVPHPAVGNARRMQVAKPALQHEVMIEAVENHNPEVIIIDEIGRELEAQAARTIAERGVQLVGTAHGQTLGNLLMNPTLSDLIGGIESVTLSDEEAKRRGTQKTVLERRSPPTFDVLVEIKERNVVIVYPDVAEAVDALVRGYELNPEIRHRTAEGRIVAEKAPSPVLEGIGFSAERNTSHVNEQTRTQSNIVQISGRSRREMNLNKRERDKNGFPELDKQSAEDNRGEDHKQLGPVRVYAHGIARNRLDQAAQRLQVPIIVVNSIDEADVLMTLRPYFRDRQPMIVSAEERQIPIYVLRSNTINQMEYSLANLFNVEVQNQATDWNDVEEETVSAIRAVLSGQVSWIDLSPADRSIRRIQHEMIEQANLLSQAFGKEPKRRIRIYKNQR